MNNGLKKSLTAEEIAEEIAALAQDGEGADKRWALNILRQGQRDESALPDPLGPQEIIERLSRLMRPCGQEACQIAYRTAFPQAKKELEDTRPRVYETELPPDVLARVARLGTLKDLYRVYPATKRSGVPAGYPRGKGPEIVKKWVQAKAMHIELDRLQETMSGEETTDGGSTAEGTADDSTVGSGS